MGIQAGHHLKKWEWHKAGKKESEGGRQSTREVKKNARGVQEARKLYNKKWSKWTKNLKKERNGGLDELFKRSEKYSDDEKPLGIYPRGGISSSGTRPSAIVHDTGRTIGKHWDGGQIRQEWMIGTKKDIRSWIGESKAEYRGKAENTGEQAAHQIKLGRLQRTSNYINSSTGGSMEPNIREHQTNGDLEWVLKQTIRKGKRTKIE